MLKIEKLFKTYDSDTFALQDVSLVVEPGEFVVVLGLLMERVIVQAIS